MVVPENQGGSLVGAIVTLRGEITALNRTQRKLIDVIARGGAFGRVGADAGGIDVGAGQDRFRALKSNLDSQELQTRTRLGRALRESLDSLQRHAIAAGAASAALLGMVRAASPQVFDTFTTAGQILTTTVAAALVPALMDLTAWLLLASEYFSNLSPEVKNLVGTFGKAVFVVGGAAGFVFALRLAIGALTKFNVTVGALAIAAMKLKEHFDKISESQERQQAAMKNRGDVVKEQAEKEVKAAREALAAGKTKEEILADFEKRELEATKAAQEAARTQARFLERGTTLTEEESKRAAGALFGQGTEADKQLALKARREQTDPNATGEALARRVRETSERLAAIRLARQEFEMQVAKPKPFEGGPEAAELKQPVAQPGQAAGVAPRPVRGRGDGGEKSLFDRFRELKDLAIASTVPRFNAGQFTAIGDLGRRAQAAAASQTPLDAKLLAKQIEILIDLRKDGKEGNELLRNLRPAVGR